MKRKAETDAESQDTREKKQRTIVRSKSETKAPSPMFVVSEFSFQDCSKRPEAHGEPIAIRTNKEAAFRLAFAQTWNYGWTECLESVHTNALHAIRDAHKLSWEERHSQLIEYAKKHIWGEPEFCMLSTQHRWDVYELTPDQMGKKDELELPDHESDDSPAADWAEWKAKADADEKKTLASEKQLRSFDRRLSKANLAGLIRKKRGETWESKTSRVMTLKCHESILEVTVDEKSACYFAVTLDDDIEIQDPEIDHDDLANLVDSLELQCQQLFAPAQTSSTSTLTLSNESRSSETGR